MKSFVWLGLLLALFTGHAWGATQGPQNAPPIIPFVSTGNCGGNTACPGVPNDSGHQFLSYDATVNAAIQQLETILSAPLTFNLPTNAATATNQATANGYLLTLSNFTTSASTSALQTSGNTTLASILTKLNASIAVTGTFWQATQPISAASLPLPTGASSATNQTNVQSAPGTPQTTAVTVQGNASAVPMPTLPGQSTTVNPDVATVTTGGTAVNAFSAGHCKYGCYLVNPINATQNLCANDLAAASGTQTNGGTICIGPGQQVRFSPTASAISAVSSDSAHAFGGKGSM